MSWNSYIDNMKAQCKDSSGVDHCDKGCIISLDDGAKWTADDNSVILELQTDEAKMISQVMKTKDFTPFMSNGIRINGEKYTFIREQEQKIMFAKKKGSGALTIQASKTAVVIGHCPEGGQQGSTNKGVAVIADYLESMNM
jgi:profilin